MGEMLLNLLLIFWLLNFFRSRLISIELKITGQWNEVILSVAENEAFPNSPCSNVESR